MHKQLLTTFAVAFCSFSIVSFPLTADAQTLLTRATVRDLRYQVELFLKDQPKKSRPAKKADNMTPGDSLQTYRQAMAELRFNDNSLARIGERAIFRFIPNTRNLRLEKGTVLLLIPPGQGRTQVNTPNAVAGIRGSALFVRYLEDTGITIVGALTDSAIEVSNADGSQTHVLKAGQLGTVYKNQIGIYDFDLKAFYDTSPLIKDIDMQGLEAVGQEMAAPQKAQVFASNNPRGVSNTPPWVLSAENRPGNLQPIATSGTSQVSPVTAFDPNKNAYEWSSVLATLKQYSDPAQPFQVPTGVLQPQPQPNLSPSLPVQPVNPGIPAQVSTPAIAPSRPLPAPATPPPQVATPPITPPANNPPAPITPPVAVGTPTTPPIFAPAPPTPTTPPAFAPAPPAPVPAAIPPVTPPALVIAPPVVTPLPTPVISTPTITAPAVPTVPAIPATPAVPGGAGVPATPAVPAVPAANVVAAPQVTPNLDLPSVQPGLGATTGAPPARPTP